MTVYEIVRVHAHGGQLVTTRVGDRTYTTEEVVDAVTELTGNVPEGTCAYGFRVHKPEARYQIVVETPGVMNGHGFRDMHITVCDFEREYGSGPGDQSLLHARVAWLNRQYIPAGSTARYTWRETTDCYADAR
jgi:hypothetical protein